MSQDNRTERATPRRRQQARERGQVARSRELVAAMATAAAIFLLAGQAGAMARDWQGLLRRSLAGAVAEGGPNFLAAVAAGPMMVARGIAIVVLASWLLAVVSAVAQGGLVFAPSALAPNMNRFSPAARLRRLLSLEAVAGFAKTVVPAGIMLYLALAILARDWRAILLLETRSAPALTAFLLGRIFEVAWKSALVLLAWAGVDYLLERRKLEQELRMSRQEILDEYKEIEGHPAVKARIRRLQRQVRRRRMLRDVERAAVVVTNPSEFAVALEYRAEMAAPVVIAKGRNLLAQQIKQAARWHGIPLLENPPLAHALYRAVEVGQSIPPKLYAVVAEVLVLVWRAQARAQAAGGEAQ
jgi:flagellar biosynthetic protein FlhB